MGWGFLLWRALRSRPTILKLRRCIQSPRNDVIIQDYAVAHHDVALCVRRDVRFVRHHDDGNPALVKLLKNCHDFDAGPTVQIPGRLVRKQHFLKADSGDDFRDL